MSVYFSNAVSYFLDVLLWQSLYCTVLFLVLWPLILFGRKRAPLLVAGCCALVLLRALLPPDLASPLSLRSLLQQRFNLEPHLIAESTTDAFGFNLTLHTPHTDIGSAHPSAGIVQQLIFFLWFSGALYGLLRLRRQRRYYRQICTRACHVRQATLIRICARWRARLGIRRPVKLISSADLPYIFTFGSLRPVIYIPKNLLQNMDAQTLEAAIAHELAHVRRYDDAWIVLQSIVRSLYFFHPLIHYCCTQWQFARELACDQTLLASGQLSAHRYAHNMLAIIAEQNPNSATDVVPAFGKGTHQHLFERFSFILKETHIMHKKWRYAGPALTLTLGTLLLPMAVAENKVSDHQTLAFQSPLEKGWMSSAYGERSWPVGDDKGKRLFHRGVDIATAAGTDIYAVAAGRVQTAVSDEKNSKHPKYGKYIVIEHADNMSSWYLHLQSVRVSPGDTLQAGTLIGKVGSSGVSSGPHLHFELHQNDEPVDPNVYIRFDFPSEKVVD